MAVPGVSSSQTPDRRRPGSNSWQNPGPSIAHAHEARLPRLYASRAQLCPVPCARSMRASQKSYRLYNCARCAVQVRICSGCDRGNQYCAGDCARIRRRESQCRAGVRYQSTFRGASMHAARQSAWRVRRTQIVTHQGSVPGIDAGIVVSTLPVTEESDVELVALLPILRRAHMHSRVSLCSFCWRRLPVFARLGPLRCGP